MLEVLQKKERRSKKRKITACVETKLKKAFKNKKWLVDIEKKHCNSIKSIALKSDSSIDLTSRFISGKMLMFPTGSLRSSIYPNEAVKEVYARYDIKKCYLHLNLTNTDSCLLFIIFIYRKECDI